jgi:hypothetical protein
MPYLTKAQKETADNMPYLTKAQKETADKNVSRIRE